MGWKQSEKPRTLLASKALVEEFAEMEPAPHDRPLSEKRMQVYERILRSGEFRTVTWASALCAETNCTYRVNGKHTATLLSKLDKLPDFHVTIERYYCDTLNDVAKLYNTFDSTLASRTTTDINLAFAATIRELAGVTPKIINLTVAAATFHQWSDGELKRVPPAERAELLIDNTSFALWLQGFTPGYGGAPETRVGSTRPLFRTPVACAMISTYRKGPRLCDEFWTAVRDETATDRNDPTRALARYLAQVIVAGGMGRTAAGKKAIGQREIYAKCIHAWNAWRKGETTALKYHASAPLPVAVAAK